MRRAALVTGASRGLGLAVARELANRGWSDLGLACRTPGRSIEQAAGEFRETGARVLTLEGDLAEPGVPDLITGRFLAFTGGRLDLLVNNAGCFSAALVSRLPDDEWDRQVAVNLSAPFRMMRAAGDALAACRGAVINVSSLCGFKGAAGAGPYSAAKAGLEALTRSAAVEWGGAGVRVNAVIPGFMSDTDMGRCSSKEYVSQVLSQSPLGRPADVLSAARLVSLLAELPAVTGQVINLEGRVGSAGALEFGEE